MIVIIVVVPCLLLLVNKCQSEAPEGYHVVSVVCGVVCTVIFVSNPTTVLGLCFGCVVLSLGL